MTINEMRQEVVFEPRNADGMLHWFIAARDDRKQHAIVVTRPQPSPAEKELIRIAMLPFYRDSLFRKYGGPL
mgnify:CR=1 FL=1